MLAPINQTPKLLGGPLQGLPKVVVAAQQVAQQAGDQLKLGKPFEQLSRPEQQQAVADAFNRLDRANARICSIEAGTGGISLNRLDRLDGLYMARAQAEADIEHYRESQPDMVALEEQKHTTLGKVENFMSGLVKSIMDYPIGHPVHIGPDNNPLFE